ncbi:MAG: DUF1638 domain-containing protein [Negativicutes bacterium]|nr:DUF1638 domain-containing protein [Negativicutes bacterium]
MRLALIACSVFEPEISAIAGGFPQIRAVEFFSMARHDVPAAMRRELQGLLDSHQRPELFDGILLLCGWCGGGVDGLRSGKLPLSIPRAHDCREILAGSSDRCRRLGLHQPGVLTVSAGWGRQSQRNPAMVYWDDSPDDICRRFGADNGIFLYQQLIADKISRIVYLAGDRRVETEGINHSRRVAARIGAGWQVKQKRLDWIKTLTGNGGPAGIICRKSAGQAITLPDIVSDG